MNELELLERVEPACPGHLVDVLEHAANLLDRRRQIRECLAVVQLRRRRRARVTERALNARDRVGPQLPQRMHIAQPALVRPREPGSRCGDSQGDEVAKNPVLRGARGMEEERDGDHAEVDGCHRRGRTCKLSSRHEVVSTTADAGGFFQPRGTEGAPMGFDMPIRYHPRRRGVAQPG